MKANASDLCTVPGIGKDIAGKLRWSVEEPRIEYRPANFIEHAPRKAALMPAPHASETDR